MYYDLIIHPSRIELIQRVFSPENNKFREKKISSADLDFKFDTEVVESGRHYTSLRSSLKNLLDPFRKELSVLNIVVLPSFVSFRALESNTSMSDMDFYVNWEASKAATDNPDRYNYGTLHDPSRNILIIALMRKSVRDYFNGIMKDIYQDGLEFKVGCRYSLSGERTEFIHIEKQIIDNYSFEPEIVESSVKKKSVFISLAFLFMTAVLAAFYYMNPSQFNDLTGFWGKYVLRNIISEDVPAVPEETQEIAEVREEQPAVQEPEIPAEATESPVILEPAVAEPAPVKETVPVKEAVTEIPVKQEVQPPPAPPPVKKAVVPTPKPVKAEEKAVLAETPVFWDLVTEMIKLEADSVVFVNNTGLSVYSTNPGILKKAKDLDPEKIYTITEKDDHIVFSDDSFVFTNSRLRSNYNKFVQIKDSYNIEPIKYHKNIFRIEPADIFFSFFDSIADSDIGFKKFIVTNKKTYIMFTVYFG